MYIKLTLTVNGMDTVKTYTGITKLSFAPSADLAGASIPINEYQADVHTVDDIPLGIYAELRDDLNALWARYRVVYAEHLDAATVRLRAQSDVGVLDRVRLPAVYYDGEDLEDVLDGIVLYQKGEEDPDTGLTPEDDPMPYTLDASFASVTVTGFCPEQTARERLLWVCFSIGAWVKTFFNQTIEILPIDDDAAAIPADKIFINPKPAVTYKDWVTAIRLKTYAFTQGTPQAAETYVTTAEGDTYIVTESYVLLKNANAPQGAPDNVISVEGVYLINASNASALLTNLAAWYFGRAEIDCDAVDNAEYLPGDRVTVQTDDAALYTGYIDSASFSFGVQARARLHLTAAAATPSALLTIVYRYGQISVGRREYRLPVGHAYTIQAPYIDIELNGHRYILRPTSATVTGTLTAAGATVTQAMAVALDLFQGVLHVISVDEVTTDTATEGEDTINIGVIS